MEVGFETRITPGDLYDYMLHHSYSSMSGLLGTMVGALMIVGFFMNMDNVLLLIVGIVVLAYLPWNLFLKSRQQALNNPAFRKPLTYLLDEEGIHVSQDDVTQLQKWEDMVKVGEQIGSSISNPFATPWVKTVLPTPRSPSSVTTCPGVASFPI